MSDLRCRGCDAIAIETSYGPWCDVCGGVMLRTGEPYVRHVATASGPGGEFKILFDHTLRTYTVSVPMKTRTWIEIKQEFVQATKTFMFIGTLDFVIALIQPYARGESVDFPSLVVGSGINAEETAIVADTFENPDGHPPQQTTRIENLGMDKV